MTLVEMEGPVVVCTFSSLREANWITSKDKKQVCETWIYISFDTVPQVRSKDIKRFCNAFMTILLRTSQKVIYPNPFLKLVGENYSTKLLHVLWTLYKDSQPKEQQ
jgi:hypothetical protein